MTDSVTPRAPDPPLVDPETGETKPLSPQALAAGLKEVFDYMMDVQHPPPSPQSTRTPEYAELLVLVVDPVKRIAYTDGTWGPDDAT